MGEEKAYRSQQKQHERRVGTQKAGHRIAFRRFLRNAFRLLSDSGVSVIGLFEQIHDDHRNDHRYYIHPQQNRHSSFFNDASDDHRSHREARGSESARQTVHYTVSRLLIFEAERGHHGLVCELDHIDQRIYKENNRFIPGREHQDRGACHDDHYRDDDKAPVREIPGFVNDPGYHGLQDRRNDIRDRKKHPDLGIAEAL